MVVAYAVNGADFLTFGVHVTASGGIVNGLKRKEVKRYDWKEYDGEVVDLSTPRYEAREITLECALVASSPSEFLSRLNAFVAAWDKEGLQRLVVTIDPVKPLIYDVYRSDEVKVNKEWSSGSMCGTLSLKFREPEPLKRVLKHTCSDVAVACSITASGGRVLTAGWGDGLFDSVAVAALTHNYTKTGVYYITLTGADGVTLDANTVEIWGRL